MDIEIEAPDGTIYTEANIAVSDSINIVEELSSDTRRVVHVANPSLGNWSIGVVDSTNLGEVVFSAFTSANPATLQINTIEEDGRGSDKTKQNWTGLDKSPQYFYSFSSTFVLIWGDLSPLTSGLQPLLVKSLSSFVPVFARGQRKPRNRYR